MLENDIVEILGFSLEVKLGRRMAEAPRVAEIEPGNLVARLSQKGRSIAETEERVEDLAGPAGAAAPA